MPAHRFLATLVALVCFAQFSAHAAVVTLNPPRDNTVIQPDNGTLLSNGQGDLFVGRTNQDVPGPPEKSIRRGLIYFDVAGGLIPANSIIDSVKLTMVDVMGRNGNRTVTLQRALADWGEGGSEFPGGVGAPPQTNDVTWLHRFFDDDTKLWTTPGGDWDSQVSASTVVNEGPQFQSFVWSSAQMAADVQAWLNDPSTNFGWFILGDETVGQTAKRFRGGEAVNVSERPQLEITYTIVPEPTTFVLLAMAGVGLAIVARSKRRVN
jgi:hypothetical protein